MSDITCDVLIVGLGPTGAVLAGLLAQASVSVLAIDREADLYPLPRAAHFDGETMQTFARLGIAQVAEAQSRPLAGYEFHNGAGEVLMRFDNRSQAGSRWAASYMFHQPAVERALRGALEALPGLNVRLSTRLAAITRNDADGVEAEIETPGGPQSVRARYLVGCDGGSSPVRGTIGGALFDYGFDEPWLVVDCTASDEADLPQYGLQVCDPGRPTTVMPMSPLRRRWEFMLLPGETAEGMLADGVAEGLLAAWGRPGQLSVVRKAVYRFHGLVAEQWRKDGVLLAGDAAHQMPPFMGQGMCSGVRDAANLAWKLAWVIKGQAGEGLLDSYQSERDPHVRAIIQTAIAMGRMVCTLDPAVAALRDQAMLAGAPPPPISPPATGPGMFMRGQGSGGYVGCLAEDLAGCGFELVTLGAWAGGLPMGVSHRRAGDAAGRWLKSQGADAALVRPDGYVFGAGDAGALVEALAVGLRGQENYSGHARDASMPLAE